MSDEKIRRLAREGLGVGLAVRYGQITTGEAQGPLALHEAICATLGCTSPLTHSDCSYCMACRRSKHLVSPKPLKAKRVSTSYIRYNKLCAVVDIPCDCCH